MVVSFAIVRRGNPPPMFQGRLRLYNFKLFDWIFHDALVDILSKMTTRSHPAFAAEQSTIF